MGGDVVVDGDVESTWRFIGIVVFGRRCGCSDGGGGGGGTMTSSDYYYYY